MGITDHIENFVTKVSLQGVETMTRQQNIISAGFRTMHGDIRGGADSMNRAGVSAVGFAAAGTALAGAGVILGRQIKDTTIRIDSMRQGLIAIEGSSAAAEKELGRLFTISRAPGLSFDQAVQGYVNLRAVGAAAGDAEDVVKGLGKGLATVGGSAEQMSGAIKAVRDIAAYGKVTGDNIRQLSNWLPQIRMIMKQQWGVTTGEELSNMGIGSADFLKGIARGLNALPQPAEALQTSVDNLNDSWSQFLYGKGGSKGGLQAFYQVSTKVIDGLTGINNATGGMAAVVVAGGAIVVGTAALMRPGILLLADAWRQVAGAATTAAVAQQGAAVAGASAGGIKGLAPAGYMSGGNSAVVGGKFGNLKGWGVGIGAGIVGAVISGLTSSGGAEAAAAKNAGRSSLGASGKAGLNVLGGGISGAATGAMIGSIIPGLGTAVGGAIGGVAGAGISAYNQISQFKAGLKTPVADNLAKSSNEHLAKIQQLLEKQVNGVVGGGNRVAKAWNTGDLERAVMGTLARGVV